MTLPEPLFPSARGLSGQPAGFDGPLERRPGGGGEAHPLATRMAATLRADGLPTDLADDLAGVALLQQARAQTIRIHLASSRILQALQPLML